MSAHPYECDLVPPVFDDGSANPEAYQPRVRFNFSNGWSVSLLIRTRPPGTKAMMAALAACPSNKWGCGITEVGETEASPEEVAAFLSEVAARPRPCS